MRTMSSALVDHYGQETMTMATCFRITLDSQQPVITSVAQASSGVIQTKYPHRLSTGDTIQVVEVEGMTELNDNFYTASVITSTVFEINAETSAFTAYTSGGRARLTFGLTNIDQNIEFEGVTYYADVGIMPSQMRTLVDMAVSDFDATGVYTDQINISRADIVAGKLNNAEYEVFQVDYSSTGSGKAIFGFGRLGDMKLERNAYVAEFRSLSELLKQDTLRVTSADCPYDLYDSQKCKVAVASYTASGTIQSATDRQNFVGTTSTESDGWYTNGWFIFTSGENAGYEFEVKNYTSGGVFELYDAPPFAVVSSISYEVRAGCDKSFTGTHGCKTKFDNATNFGGHPHLPGQARLTKVGGSG